MLEEGEGEAWDEGVGEEWDEGVGEAWDEGVCYSSLRAGAHA